MKTAMLSLTLGAALISALAPTRAATTLKTTKKAVHERAAQIIAWITEVLDSGELPRRDINQKRWPKHSQRRLNAGKDIAGGWSAAFWGFKGGG